MKAFEGPGGFLIEFPQNFIKIQPQEDQKMSKMSFHEIFFNLLHPERKCEENTKRTQSKYEKNIIEMQKKYKGHKGLPVWMWALNHWLFRFFEVSGDFPWAPKALCGPEKGM